MSLTLRGLKVNIKHLCVNRLPMATPCIFKEVVVIKGFVYNKVNCPICHNTFIVDKDGRIMN